MKKHTKDEWDDDVDNDMKPEGSRKGQKTSKKGNKRSSKDSNDEEVDPRAKLNPLKLPYTTGWGPLNEAILTNGHAIVALELLANGYFDYQIAAQFGVSIRTLHYWKDNHPDLKKAWELGEAACHSFWTLRLQHMALTGDEAGYKATMAILNNRFRYDWGADDRKSANNVQNIHINQMNVVKNLPTRDLVNELNAQIDKFKSLKVLDSDFSNVELAPEELVDNTKLLDTVIQPKDETNGQ